MIADDVFLSLQQQGAALQGTLTLVFRSDATCSGGNTGLSRELEVNGTLDGSTIMFAARRDSTQGIVSGDFIGSADGGRMSGTFVALGAGGSTGSGVWSLAR